MVDALSSFFFLMMLTSTFCREPLSWGLLLVVVSVVSHSLQIWLFPILVKFDIRINL